MDLQAQKLEVVRLVLDADDANILSEVKALFKKSQSEKDLADFYSGFRDGIREVKSSVKGNVKLKDSKNWLAEL